MTTEKQDLLKEQLRDLKGVRAVLVKENSKYHNADYMEKAVASLILVCQEERAVLEKLEALGEA